MLSASLAAAQAAWPAGNPLDDALVQALDRGDLPRIERLVGGGADVNSRNGQGKTPLIVAAKAGDAALVRKLIAAGADVNQITDNGGTALMFAAIGGDLATVRALLASGAEVNVVGGFDWTALMVATVKGHVDVVRALIDAGADANLPDIYGWTPLMRAVYADRVEVVQALLEWPALDLEHHNDQGATALHFAAAGGDEVLVRRLLDRGANPMSQDREGRTPSQRALASGHANVAEILETYRTR